MGIKKIVRKGECEGEEAMGQCVPNDHLKEQACKFGSKLNGRRRIRFDSSCF